MKFCTTCGEVYPSSAETCAADDSFLESWTQVPRIEAQEDLDDEEDLDDDSSEEHTAVELVPAARGKKGTDSTKSIDINDPVTLAEFDATAQTGEHTALRMVAYDDEESAFLGMLVGNRYRLDKQIGTGGFGVVYDAFDTENENRVAIKILSPTMSANRRTLTRFRREALAASRIQHPGIIKVEDFGIADDGVSYIVMEYLDGHDLAAVIAANQTMDPIRAMEIIMQCARALAAAHKEGVWHRDLKPANIFLTQSPQGTDSIKILDFGIAKDRNSNPRTADLTSASKVVGTPYYMSPEQARGTELDGRADLYSLGIILYELLTGVRPFLGNSPYEILVAHARAPRVAPSKHRRSLKDYPMLDDVVLKSIAASADDRFVSMEQFAEALNNRLGAAAFSGDMVSNPFKVSTALVPGPSSPVEVRRKRRFPVWILAATPAVAAGAIFLMSEGKVPEATQSLPKPAALIAPAQPAIKAVPLETPTPAMALKPADPIPQPAEDLKEKRLIVETAVKQRNVETAVKQHNAEAAVKQHDVEAAVKRDVEAAVKQRGVEKVKHSRRAKNKRKFKGRRTKGKGKGKRVVSKTEGFAEW